MPTVHDSYKSTEPVDYDATKQASADRLAQTAPALLAACKATEELLSRLWTPNAPTVAELALLRGRLEAVIVAVTGERAVRAAWDTTEQKIQLGTEPVIKLTSESAADSEAGESWPDTGYLAQP